MHSLASHWDRHTATRQSLPCNSCWSPESSIQTSFSIG